MNEELKSKLKGAQSLQEVETILADEPHLDAKRIYEELNNHRSNESKLLDMGELEAVSGGADRSWTKDGCAATCEYNSWCGSNDFCYFFYVTYDDFWATCPRWA